MILFVVAGLASPPEPLGPATTTVETGSIAAIFAPPPHAVRTKAGPFGTWLRERTVSPPDRKVKTHDGRVVNHDARVVDIGLVSGDLQQCADSAIRLRAEWLKETGAPVSFHATSGDPLPWARWQKGQRPVERNHRIAWVSGTRGGWEGYLSKVFNWAGTRSLHAYDTAPVVGPPRVGDVLVAPGSPGHAVILMDVATRGNDTYVLIGEGFMPAQDFHIELGPEQGWWRWGPGVDLGHWDLRVDPTNPGDVHRRFK